MKLTEIMEQMLDIFTQVTLKPAAVDMKLNMKFYYTELTDFDRMTYDTVDVCFSMTPERQFPIASTEKDRKILQEFSKLALQWKDITEVAPRPISIPKWLRCCCCRRTERTSCGFFYKLLFGDIKQLGLVLKRQFQTKHFWVRTTDGEKLDCMLFKSHEDAKIM